MAERYSFQFGPPKDPGFQPDPDYYKSVSAGASKINLHEKAKPLTKEELIMRGLHESVLAQNPIQEKLSLVGRGAGILIGRLGDSRELIEKIVSERFVGIAEHNIDILSLYLKRLGKSEDGLGYQSSIDFLKSSVEAYSKGEPLQVALHFQPNSNEEAIDQTLTLTHPNPQYQT